MSVDFSDDCTIKKGLPFGKPLFYFVYTKLHRPTWKGKYDGDVCEEYTS